jgi:DNA-binding transcriptional ArsR family regulator
MPNRADRRAGHREVRRLRKDPHRRRRFLNHVRSDTSVIRAAIATLDALLEFSNDSAGPVFPSQARLAHDTGQSPRTVQRHLRELRDAGYLAVYVYEPERDATTGRWRRRKTNRYYFTFCKTPGNGRRVRRKGRSHLHDTDGVSNPLGISNHRPKAGDGGTQDLSLDDRKHGAPTAPHSQPQSTTWSDDKGCQSCDFTGFVLDDTGLATRCTCSQT